MKTALVVAVSLTAGLALGGAVGWVTYPAPEDGPEEADTAPRETHEINSRQPEFVKLNNQFVVPIVGRSRVEALMVISLSLETIPGLSERVFSLEPKLRDLFLQVMFDHANMGGFDGSFTQASNLEGLRRALREVAQAQLGKDVSNVLIVDIVRQDI